MDPTKLLESDHRKVEALFDAIEKAEGADRMPLIEELETALRTHMQLEEQVIYPAMAPITGDEAVEEGNTEHELVRSTMQSMLDLAPDEPGFGAALESMQAGIDHHVREEEGDVFPELRRDSSILEKISAEFMKTRLDLGMPMDAEALATASTKEELLAEASSASIDGASSMTKAELAEALASAMALAS